MYLFCFQPLLFCWSEENLACAPVWSAEAHYLLHLHKIPVSCLNLFIGERHILRVCVTSRWAWPLFARSAGRACRRLQQPLTFSGCQQTRGSPPVTSAALTWRVKASPRARWHRPHQPEPRLPSLNKTQKNVAPQKHSESFFQSFPTEDKVTCLSVDQSAWIELMALELFFCWLRRRQIWWVIGELCSAVSRCGPAIRAVNRRPELLSPHLPPGMPLWPAPRPCREGADATERHDKCIPMSLLSRSIDQYCRRPDWNISPDVFLWSLTYLEEIEGIDQPGTKWL